MKNKIKTPKSLVKRIRKISKSGKIFVGAMSSQHLAAQKDGRSTRASGKSRQLSKSDSNRLSKLLSNVRIK